MEVTSPTMVELTETPTHSCKMAILSVHDAIYVLGGKWKTTIVACLLYGPKRYSDMLREVPGISGKMLSRELKEMETNYLIKRIVSESQPITVSYELTEYGETVKPVIEVLANWGYAHRQRVADKG